VLAGAAIDLAVSAHTHRWRIIRVGEMGNPYPAVIGGGPEMDRATVIELTADTAGLRAVIKDADGQQLDQFTGARTR